MGRLVVAIWMAALVSMPSTLMAQGRPAQVGVDAVTTQPFVQTRPALGQFVARQSGELAARVEGPVEQVMVSVGDRVTNGQVLVRLDRARIEIGQALAEADLVASKSEVATAQAELALLEQERIRLARLQGSAAFSAARLDDKVQEITVAQSRVNAANARLARSELLARSRQMDLSDSELKAPFAGVIVRKLVSAGDYVTVGDPVIEIIDDQNIEIAAEVPSESVGDLELGGEVTFRLGTGGEVHKAVLRAILPIEDVMTRTRAVRLSPQEQGERWASGQTVVVNLPEGGGREVATVHKDAVLIRQGGRTVFVVGKENKVRPQAIEIGAAVGDRFEVTSGLKAGDLVVVRGNERLRPGQDVSFAPPGAAAEGQSGGAGGGRS